MENVPLFIPVIFGLTALITIYLFYLAVHKSKNFLLFIFIWMLIQLFLGLSGFYLITDTLPPRFFLAPGPPVLLIILLFLSPSGREFIDRLDLRYLTILHIVRIPVELVLFGLFIYKVIPELMTFEGRNFDIFSGITAPFIYYFGFVRKSLNWKILLLWNIICLLLLINIVIYAVLCAPFSFQQFAFDQPNIAVLYFPYNWLPSIVVPLVLMSHLAAIRQLLKNKNIANQSVSL